MMESPNPLRIGIGWYTPASYAELLGIADDCSALPDIFEEWEKQARKTLFIMKGEGHEPAQVFVNIDELAAWCRKRDLPINGKSRTDFVSKKLHESGPIRPLQV